MRIQVNADVCQGHARCFMIEPEVFDLDDNGHVSVRVQDIDPARRQTVREAVANCPERALQLVDDS